MEKKNNTTSIESAFKQTSNNYNNKNIKSRLVIQQFLDSLKQQNKTTITNETEEQVPQCIFLGALCLKPVPNIFQVTLQPISFNPNSAFFNNNDETNKVPTNSKTLLKLFTNNNLMDELKSSNTEDSKVEYSLARLRKNSVQVKSMNCLNKTAITVQNSRTSSDLIEINEDDIEDYLEIDQNVVKDLEALIPDEEIETITNNLIKPVEKSPDNFQEKTGKNEVNCTNDGKENQQSIKIENKVNDLLETIEINEEILSEPSTPKRKTSQRIINNKKLKLEVISLSKNFQCEEVSIEEANDKKENIPEVKILRSNSKPKPIESTTRRKIQEKNEKTPKSSPKNDSPTTEIIKDSVEINKSTPKKKKIKTKHKKHSLEKRKKSPNKRNSRSFQKDDLTAFEEKITRFSRRVKTKVNIKIPVVEVIEEKFVVEPRESHETKNKGNEQRECETLQTPGTKLKKKTSKRRKTGNKKVKKKKPPQPPPSLELATKIENVELMNNNDILKNSEEKKTETKEIKNIETGRGSAEISEAKYQVDRNEDTKKMEEIVPSGECNTTEVERYRRIYKCRVCLKIFETYNRLKAHKRVHQVKNPYQCQECGNSYDDVEELAAHLRIHKGKMPYPCKKCDSSFWTTVQLERHQLVHVLKKVTPTNTSAPKKIFKCEVCGKEFKKICDLERHTRVHTGEKPSVCNICNKRFQQAYNLNKHLLIHTQEKNFECVICQKKFGRNDVLNRHVLTHSIDKPFHCSICSKSFIRSTQLNLHFKKHHVLKEETQTSDNNTNESVDDPVAGKSSD